MKFILSLVLSSFWLGIVLGQQYAGDTIPNTLPIVNGAEKAFFNVFDSAGGRTTLINYFSMPNGMRQDKTQVQRAVVMLHGANRDAGTYMVHLANSLRTATAIDPSVNESTVALMAPCFTNTDDGTSGQVTMQTNNVIAWSGTSWYEGYTNIFPANARNVSSFDAMDQILQYFADASQYPNLKQIVVAGHSMGAQMVLRYAAVGKVLDLRVPVTYWSGNPSSYLWFNTSRPLSTTQCSTYDDWSQGFSNYTIPYEAAFIRSQGAEGAKARYDSRIIGYGRALNDFGDYSEGKCGPYTHGGNRMERFLNFINYFPPQPGNTVDYYPNVGHDAGVMTSQTPGVYRLYFDNFNGNGSRHVDFGPRQLPGDDPFPA